MNYLYETAGDIISLSSTVLEGLNHIKLRMEEGQLKETLFLFEDVLEALISIENSVQPLMEKEKELGKAVAVIKQSLEMLARAYEEDNLAKAQNALNENLLPALDKLRAELDASLQKYKDS